MRRSLRTIRSIPRIKDIAVILGKHGFYQVAGSLQAPFRTTLRWLLRREPRHVIQQPERLRIVLEELGPTFIKFGQLLSTRPDLLPSEYIGELGKLQDDVRPAPFSEILSLLKEEFEKDPRDLFRDIDPNPLASASIAQVHRATTVSGESVVVKVRKRGLKNIVRQDMQVLGVLAEFLSGWRALRLFDPEGAIRLFERSIQRELNFDYERYNLLRLHKNLRDETRIHVPTVYPELSRQGVLTMEYLEGEKMTTLRNHPLPQAQGGRLGTDIALCILKQVFEDGMYHADPHPGNFILMSDGRVGLIDFGNVGRFTLQMRDDLLRLLLALIRRDYREVSRWVLKRGQATQGINGHALALELMDMLDPYYGLSLGDIQIGGLFNSLFGLLLRHGIGVPAPYVHAGRTFVALEGVVRLCSPGLELLPAIQPYIRKLSQRRWAPERLARDLQNDVSEIAAAVRSYPRDLAEILSRAAEGRLRVETEVSGMKVFTEKLDSASSRIQVAVLASGLLISSAILLFAAGPPSLQNVLGIGGCFGALVLMARLLVR